MSDAILRWISTLSFLFLSVAALIFALRGLTPPAVAMDPPPDAACLYLPPGLSVISQADGMEQWMNEQINQGRSHFLSNPNQHGVGILCAW
jgi:hypothetical protein